MKQIFSFVSIALLLMAFGLKLSAQQDCASAVEISSLPYSETGLTTTAMGNNYSSTDACGSTAMDNEEYVFSFTPTEDMQINIALSNTALTPAAAALAAKIGLFITEGCPDVGTCLASITTESANPSLSDINLTSGTTYYIIISSSSVVFLAPTTNVNFDISITKNLEDDLGVTSIEGLTSECGLGNNEIISCNIKNFGLSPQTGFDVTFTINEASPITETYSGTIAPGTSASYTFTSTANLSSIGEYIIHVYTNIAGDENTLNDGTTITIVNMPIYSEFPITEDFESGTGYWSTGGTASSWVHGSPDASLPELVINSAHSGDNIWVTKLTGNTNTSEVSYIESPCYDLSSLSYPTIELYAWVNFSIYGNSGNIKASIDGGATWPITVHTFATTTSWKYISAMSTELIGETNVKFRINYTSGMLAANGIAIDDFTIKEAVLLDVGITDIITPINSCGLTDAETVSVEITNFGAEAISNIIVDYSIDGGTTWLASPETVSTTIEPAGTYFYDFTTTCDLSTIGSYDIIAKTAQPGDEDNTNDEYQKTISSQETISAFDYEESFESGDGGWHTYGTNSTMELAMPANTLINSAGDGDYAWVTNATGFNNSNEISYLESPCFDFTDFVHPVIEVMIQYETNMMMANFSLEYSLDNGVLWDTVKAGVAAANWYGASDDIFSFGTWNGSSAGWQIASTNIPFLINQTSVKFRFVFNNGMFSMQDTEGVAIDLFKISDCTTFPTASFTYNVEGNFVYFTNESENATSYSWNFGDNQLTPSTSTDENPVFNYTVGGSYTVTLTASNGCSTDTYSTTIDISTSVCETNISSGIYPNPANSQLFINIENTSEFSYQIININGQLMQSGISIDNGTGIDISEMSSGVYFIKIKTSNESFINQFIKE
ncbi:MAG: T9SS type A sorting domain-containing protein [Bacteroidales bacterium]|nr:T9SS type A sorting domain-containing protein [Bacteroidales bacterium]MDY0140648.1 T9SS type A sorting domain-containing protein [Bacteroidales bacterium]